MGTTLYEVGTGNPVNFVHIVDAKEAMNTGQYTIQAPPVVVEKKVVEKPKVAEKKVEEKPKVVEKPEPIAVVNVADKVEVEEIKPKPIRKIMKE